MTTTRKAVLLVGAIVATGAGGQVHATPYTLTTTGAISTGTDALGLFGPAGGNLTGDAYRLSVEYDASGPNVTTPTFQQVSGPVTGPVTATVNGISTAIPVTTSLGALLEAFNNGGSSELLGLQSGTNDAAGQFVSTSQEVFSPTANVTGLVLASTSYTTQPADFTAVSFTTSLGFTTTSFDATVSTIDLAVVPEPSSLSTLVAGLLGLAYAFWSRRPFLRRGSDHSAE